MKYKVFKNIETGKYFGHLNNTYTKPVEYDNVNLAYRFTNNINLEDYETVFYKNELRKQKIKKLNETNQIKI